MIIENNGKYIKSTDFFDSDLAGKGGVYLSVNGGAFRLLVPDPLTDALDDFKTAEYVIITYGMLREHQAIELLFEDNSESPYAIHISVQQADRTLPASEMGRVDIPFLVYDRTGLVHETSCRLRKTDSLPYLKPWEDKTSHG